MRYWQGDRRAARELLDNALRIRRDALPADDPALAETLTWYGHATCIDGDPLLADTRDLLTQRRGEDDPLIREIYGSKQ